MKEFNFNEIDDFDSHINLSIPSYDKLFSLFVELATIYSRNTSFVIDYGCSTGRLLKTLPERKNCKYIGIDCANLLPTESTEQCTFIKTDAVTETITQEMRKDAVVVSMFFLQFLTERNRKIMLAKMKETVSSGGVLLISEKVILNDPYLESVLARIFLNTKRGKFTDSEILTKDKELVYSMFCKTQSRLLEELEQIGNVTQVWQSYNFMGFVVK